MIKELIESIKKNEGYVGRVYKDTLGFDTIGYGFKLESLYLSKDVCDIVLKYKLDALIRQIKKQFEWIDTMPETIQEVIIEMCYQLGTFGFSKFRKTIMYLKEKNWLKASEEMLDSRWYKQTPSRARMLSEKVKNYK